MVPALRAQLLEDDGDYLRTLSLLGEAVSMSVQDSSPIMWRGSLLLRTGYVDEAIADLEKAREMDPLAGINNGYLAIAYLSAGRYAKAEEAARKSLSQGWSPAIYVIIYDLAARGEHEHAVALWDELIAPAAPKESASQVAETRAILLNPGNSKPVGVMRDNLVESGSEFSIAINQFDLLFEFAENQLKRDPYAREKQWWLRSAWMPSTLALREDPRFFAIADDLGMVRLWEARGYPQGCKRVRAASGDRLDCPGVSR
jgi:tetratricopeptide (TPR) repeat protein